MKWQNILKSCIVVMAITRSPHTFAERESGGSEWPFSILVSLPWDSPEKPQVESKVLAYLSKQAARDNVAHLVMYYDRKLKSRNICMSFSEFWNNDKFVAEISQLLQGDVHRADGVHVSLAQECDPTE